MKYSKSDFDDIYSLHNKRITNFCISFVGGNTIHTFDIQDVVQETFISVYSNIEKYGGDSSKLSTWIIKIAKNKIIDQFRISIKRKEYLTDWNIEKPDNYIDERLLSYESKQYDNRIERILKTINELDETKKNIMYMHYIYGYDTTEIARHYNCKPARIRKIVSRTLEFLRPS